MAHGLRVHWRRIECVGVFQPATTTCRVGMALHGSHDFSVSRIAWGKSVRTVSNARITVTIFEKNLVRVTLV